jgi:hypothetical protein|tara:strand:+ start:1037 stop:1483 length:447 start_codon:yes stop_codon:yes gene_type:complete
MMKMNQEVITSQETAPISITPEHREEILQTISDMSKDATGRRLRYNYTSMSDGELLRLVEYFADEIDSNIQIEAENDANALDEYEAHLTSLMSDFSISKADALRWDMEAEDETDDDVEHYLWKKGIGFSDMAPYKELAKLWKEENRDD